MSYIFWPDRGETPESIRRQRDLAALMMRQQRAPQNVGEGWGAIANGIVSAVLNHRAANAEKSMMAAAADARGTMADYFTNRNYFPPAPSSAPGNLPSGQELSGEPQPLDYASQRVSQAHGGSNYRDAIASIESAGSGDYAAVGPTHPELGRALGRYQVMEANIGPWSKKHLGREITADEFLKNPAFQDAIFDGEFGSYVQKYGPEGAAQAWFGGPGGVGKLDRKDSLGTSIGEYTDKFRNALGPSQQALESLAVGESIPMPQQQPVQVAQAGGGFPEMAGNSPQMPPHDVGMLLQVLSTPGIDDATKALASAALEQYAQSQDPSHLLDMEYKRAQTQKLQREMERGRIHNAGDGVFYNEDTGEWITAPDRGPDFRMASPEEAAAYGAAAGQFGPDGRFYPINPPSGMSIESDGQGGFRMVQGPGAGGKSFTEGQTKDNVYSTRARGALPTLNEFENSLAEYGDRLLDNDPTGVLRGRWQSEDYQVARAAGDEFLQAILRKDTGAAITAQEQELYGKTYLPQPGDSPEVILYKREARERAIAAIESGMSPAQIIAQERALERSSRAANIPQGAVEMLRSNPSLATQFDEKYGEGAAARVLGGQ